MAPLPPSLSYPESLRGSALSVLKKALGIEAKSVSSSTSRTQLPSGFLTLKHSKILGYGTTDKHPEQGEECFAVSMDKRGAVRGSRIRGVKAETAYRLPRRARPASRSETLPPRHVTGSEIM